MRILAIEKENSETAGPDATPFLEGEAKRVWELYRDGQLREIWFTMTDHRAVLLLECSSEQEAIALLSTLPLVREQCIAFEVLPLKPYSGLERLFR